ncbi:MAG: tetratricopeptide repeat protein, partial [Armatimonadetes bacterium]|nr:tetratricopeptide repeat protein [Armatimonadota bacterium]MDW8122036.1 tetratricopeptide repeat protein [Armatimonadota bacterium]
KGFVVHYVTNAPTQQTVDRLEKAVRKDPIDGDSWAGLAMARLCLGQWEAAWEAGRKALSLGPQSPRQKATLAHYLLWTGRFQAALPLVQELSQDGKDRHWLRHQIECLEGVGRFSEALTLLDRYTPDERKRRTERIWKAVLLWKLGHLKEAADQLVPLVDSDKRARRLLRGLQASLEAAAPSQPVSSPRVAGGNNRSSVSDAAFAGWLTIYDAFTPSFVTSRFIKAAKINGPWAVSVAVSPDSPYRSQLSNALVYRVNGKTFVTPQGLMQLIEREEQSRMPGEEVVFDTWKAGNIQKIVLRILPLPMPRTQYESRRVP